MITFWKTEADSLLKTNSTGTSVQLLLFLFLGSLKNHGQNVGVRCLVIPRHSPRAVRMSPGSGSSTKARKRTQVPGKSNNHQNKKLTLLSTYCMPDSKVFIFTTILRATIILILKMRKLMLRKVIFSYFLHS